MNYYTYLNVSWSVVGNDKIIEKMNSLLGTYFYNSSLPVETNFSVDLIEKKYLDILDVLQYGQPIIIHNSKKTEIHEEGLKYDNGMTSVIYNKNTKSIYLLNYFSNKVTVFNTDKDMLCKDGIRIIRDLVKIYVEKENCSALIHAATVAKDNKGLLLLGDKGSGKTTISLKLIFDYGFNEVSRDRTFLINKESIELWGWPNYYNLTLRSLSSFESTKKLIPEKFINYTESELQTINKKFQFLPNEIGVNKTIRNVSLEHFVILINKNNNISFSVENILAENWYTPNDLNYPNWTGINLDNIKTSINNLALLNRLKDSHINIVEWKTIEEALEKINKIWEGC